MNIDRAFDIENGLKINDDGPFITGGPSSPIGLDLPTDTFYFQNTVSGILIWKKFNTGVNDWRQVSAQDIPFINTGLTTNSQDLVGVTQSQEAIAVLANRHFGKQAAFTQTAGSLTTTSSSFVTLNSLTLPSLPLGNYIILSHGDFQKTSLNAQVEVRTLVNGVDEYSVAEVALDDDDYFFQSTSLSIISASGNTTIAYQVRRASGGGDVIVRDRYLVAWRIS